jgi:uncharacterized protein (TIGR03437 family)
MTRVFILYTCIATAASGQSLFPNGLSRFAGADNSNYTGDNGPAYYAAFSGATIVASDSAGNLYVLETADIRKIDTHGIVTTLVSQVSPGGIAIDSRGATYFSQNQLTIQRINPGGTVTTIAGSGSAVYNGEGVPALSAGMAPTALAVDASGRIYFAEPANFRVRMIGSDGNVYTVAGTGQAGTGGEGGPATQAALTQPTSLAFDSAGNLYVADVFRVVKIDTHGVLTRYAGTGTGSRQVQTGIPATQSSFGAQGVATDAAGDVFVAAGPILKITPDGIIHAFAGTGTSLLVSCGNALQEWVIADSVAVDAAGDAYFFFGDGVHLFVQEATPAGTLTTIAGMGPNLFMGDGGAAASAGFAAPSGIAIDSLGRLYIADTNNNRIRMIDTNGTVTTVAGAGGATYDRNPACIPDNDTLLSYPQAVAVDAAGALYIADTGKNRIRKIAPDGTQSTIAVTSALNKPIGIAVDASGALYIADSLNSRVLKTDATGVAEASVSVPVAGGLSFDAAGNLLITSQVGIELLRMSDGALFPVASDLLEPADAVVDAAGSIYAADRGGQLVERTSIHCAIASDGQAQLQHPIGLAFDAAGNLYISDGSANAIWKAMPTPPPANESPTPTLSPYTPVTNAAPVFGLVAPGPEFSQAPSYPQQPAAPGELIHVNGACIGPFNPVTAAYDAHGNLPTTLAGVSVTMNGLALPLLSVSEGTALAQVPYEAQPVSAPASNIQLTYGGVTSVSLAPVIAAYPTLFTVNGSPFGPAVAVNQDGTTNSAANPAKKGSIVTLFGSGFGRVTPAAVTGQIAPANPLEYVAQPITLTIGTTSTLGYAGANALVLFAGNAPGFVGLTQINVQVPEAALGGGALAMWIASPAIYPQIQGNPTLYVAQ